MPETRNSRRTKALAAALTLFISALLSCLLAEIALRVLGHHPWETVVMENEPTTNEPHPVLGWQPKAGEYLIPPYHPDDPEIHIRILGGSNRITSNEQADDPDERPKILVAGCSYTFGWAISDEETYPWKLQKEFPEFEVLNYGVPGYGTCQALLKLDQVLSESTTTRLVIYGFPIHHHESRNVASGEWLEALSRFSRRGHAAVPYATLDESDNLVMNPPVSYPSTPIRNVSVAVALAEKAIVRARTRSREAAAREVTRQLLLRMRDICKDHGARLVVMIMEGPQDKRTDYSAFLAQNGIDSVDCLVLFSEDMIVRGEGHPNGKCNSLWTECLIEYLRSGTLDLLQATHTQSGLAGSSSEEASEKR